jgi:HSP20 family molecular chaperone IbpA
MTTTLSPKKREKPSSLYQQEKTKDSFQRMGLSAININEEKEEYILYAAAPGMRREDFYVSVDRKIITIIAAGKEGEPYFKNIGELHLAEQIRTFTLPDNADPLLTCATYNNGSLEIHIPKGKNTEEKPLLIHVY